MEHNGQEPANVEPWPDIEPLLRHVTSMHPHTAYSQLIVAACGIIRIAPIEAARTITDLGTKCLMAALELREEEERGKGPSH